MKTARRLFQRRQREQYVVLWYIEIAEGDFLPNISGPYNTTHEALYARDNIRYQQKREINMAQVLPLSLF